MLFMDTDHVLFIMFVQQKWYFENIKPMYFSFPYHRAPCRPHTITAKPFPREEEQSTKEGRRALGKEENMESKAATCHATGRGSRSPFHLRVGGLEEERREG